MRELIFCLYQIGRVTLGALFILGCFYIGIATMFLV